MNNILCVIDPTSEAQPALRRAVWFAKKTAAHLRLLICDYDGFLSGHGVFDSEALQHARARFMDLHYDRLNELANENFDSGLEISTDAVWDHPLHEGIVRYASSTGAEMVFKDTHPHPGLGLSSLSNSDWDIIRTCPVPLWLVKPNDFPETPQLIAAIDPLHGHDKPATLDDRILRVARSIADATGSDVHAFHAFDTTMRSPPMMAGALSAIFAPTLIIEERIRQSHNASLEKTAEDHGVSKNRTHLVAGHTCDVLPTLVSELNASLVVMGAVARNRLRRVFIGSTAERTLDRVSCDVLIVKPEWFKTPVPLDVDSAA